jgi:hypothetical protein
MYTYSTRETIMYGEVVQIDRAEIDVEQPQAPWPAEAVVRGDRELVADRALGRSNSD